MRLGPLIALLILGGAGYGAWRWIETQPAPQEGGRGRRFAQQRGGATPVAVAPVVVESVPIQREGIGNVQARQMVTVRAQIEGTLVSVEFAEGRKVKAGEVLARIDPAIYKAQFDQALAKKAQDEANLANARVDLQRYRSLAASAAGSKQQADQQEALVAQLAALVKADEAAIANARTTLGYATIVSPLDGRAGLRLVDPGNIVRANDANGLVTITQITPIDVVFTLPQRDLALVSAARAKGEVPVEVLAPGGSAAVATGTLSAIDNQIDAATGTIRLKATFPNVDEKLWPGQFVSVRVTVDRIEAARVAPATAVRRGPNGTFVYVLEGEDRVAMRPVTVAVQDERRAALSAGVEPGDKVVTVGFAGLTPGARVTIGPDIAAPAAGQAPAETAPGAASAPRDPQAPRGERGGRRRGEGQAREGQTGEGQVGEGRPRGEGRRRRGQEAPGAEAGPAPAPEGAAPK